MLKRQLSKKGKKGKRKETNIYQALAVCRGFCDTKEKKQTKDIFGFKSRENLVKE